MEIALGLVLLIFFSVLAFWRENAVLFYLIAGIALITGLTWYDTYGTPEGMTISLCLIAYSIMSLIFGFRYLFSIKKSEEEEEE